jgi:hypothetical protein
MVHLTLSLVIQSINGLNAFALAKLKALIFLPSIVFKLSGDVPRIAIRHALRLITSSLND